MASGGGIHVGLAPAAAPRTFEGTYDCDLGYLFLRSDRICFWGEETQFALLREQITAIKLASGAPGFLRTNRIFISWQDCSRGTCGVFNVSCRTQSTVSAANRQTAELAKRLQLWWQTTAPARPLPSPLASLESPRLLNVTSAIPGAVLKGGKLFKELLFMGLLAALPAVLLGLHFHLFAYLGAATYQRLGLPKMFYTPGAGWYVVGVAVLIRLVTAIPPLRYQDKPVLIAQSPAANSSADAPSMDARHNFVSLSEF